ncbi:tellurite resistance TerB family protein [Cereibacter sphaeroides]|uniref:tellurite resistance TerB family protein n=1 Tax=Cereibacter sphaeroides TaxID=1063 RepID=UPI001F4039A9|nr:DUF533 domain-containing protein [Cereibacter sphaeroides]MCE6952268.1 tellurite resistance TerB family protein [Cereibacter sphaeroides]
MSLKKVLGLMLASRMAGRGGRMGGLGTAAVLGSGAGRKAGMAALAYMAYRAWQDQQSRGGTVRGSASTGGGIGGMIGSVMDSLNGQQGGFGPAGGQAQPVQRDERMSQVPEDLISDAKALLLLQAMVAAAWADGTMSAEERQRILDQLDEGGADEADRRLVEREIARPQPLDRLLEQVRDQETAEQFYLASRAAVDPGMSANRAYLCTLRGRLNLSDAEVREVENLTS